LPSIYRYILTHDHGVAPCPQGGTITLATCKPVIRRCASVGDWVIGFRPGSMERGLVLWAGRVAEKMTHGEYQRRHPERLDAVYAENPNGTYRRLLKDYHPTASEMARDLSAPVLLFEAEGVYLNGQPELLPEDLMHIAASGRGHRVGGTSAKDEARLTAWLSTLTSSWPEPSNRVRSCAERLKSVEVRTRHRGGCSIMPEHEKPIAFQRPSCGTSNGKDLH
jgi:hypothetical protein